MVQMASKGFERPSSFLLRVTTLLIVFMFLAQYAAAGESSSMAMLRGHVHNNSDNKFYAIPRFQTSSRAVDESDDTDTIRGPHPADELLQSLDADGSQSYILGGY